jgi:general secretion pathway protein A
LRIAFAGRTKSEMLSRLNNYLVARARTGGITALVVDEAQDLTWELLEEIRLLTNLETSQHKLLQIVLVGQPEFDQKLDSPQLRQLKQRIGLRCRLEPLGLEEMRGYIQRRLELAGAKPHSSVIFPDETILLIHKYSRGVPRLANTLCENSLVSGFSRQIKTITPEIIEEVATTFRLDLNTVSSVQTPDELGTRRKALRALHRMIEEMDGITREQISETSWESGVKSE